MSQRPPWQSQSKMTTRPEVQQPQEQPLGKEKESLYICIQWTTEYRTIRFSYDHFPDNFCVRFSNDPVFRWPVLQYLSGFRMVLSWTALFLRIFFLWPFSIIKRSRLVRTIRKPDYLSGFYNDYQNTGPFENWTQIEHSNTGFVRYSDVDSI
jgi:hypothetical protein